MTNSCKSRISLLLSFLTNFTLNVRKLTITDILLIRSGLVPAGAKLWWMIKIENLEEDNMPIISLEMTTNKFAELQ